MVKQPASLSRVAPHPAARPVRFLRNGPTPRLTQPAGGAAKSRPRRGPESGNVLFPTLRSRLARSILAHARRTSSGHDRSSIPSLKTSGLFHPSLDERAPTTSLVRPGDVSVPDRLSPQPRCAFSLSRTRRRRSLRFPFAVRNLVHRLEQRLRSSFPCFAIPNRQVVACADERQTLLKVRSLDDLLGQDDPSLGVPTQPIDHPVIRFVKFLFIFAGHQTHSPLRDQLAVIIL